MLTDNLHKNLRLNEKSESRCAGEIFPSQGITAADVRCCYVFALNAVGTKVSNSEYVEV